MRAIAVRAFRGAPEAMTLPRPEVGPGEVGVRLEAVGMNPFDAKIADGILDGLRPHRFPLVLGTDGAGVVDSVGPGVARFRAGDRVFGQFLHDPVGIGTYAEFSTVPEAIGVAKVPASLSSAEAAAVPTAGMTALDALDRLRLGAGATLLVVGASGGVGSFATSLAAAAGIRVIAAVRPEGFERSRARGAAEAVEVGPGLGASVRRLAPTGVDALLDLMSPPDRFLETAELVRPGGSAATTVYAARADRSAAGVALLNIDLQPTSSLLERVGRAIEEHRIPIPVERRIRLESAPEALADLRAGRARGKTVIEL
jgi:NADPH:quinone reductase-like Zn-dependent oxidoreductase